MAQMQRHFYRLKTLLFTFWSR